MTLLRDSLLMLGLMAAALLLMLLPLPEPLLPFRPAWLLLMLSAWTLQRGHEVALPAAFLAALLLDAARGVTLGLHGVALLIPLAIVVQWRAPLRALPLWQSALAAIGLFVLHAALLTLLDGITGERSDASAHWWPILLSTLLWPLAVLLLQPRPDSNRPG